MQIILQIETLYYHLITIVAVSQLNIDIIFIRKQSFITSCARYIIIKYNT